MTMKKQQYSQHLSMPLLWPDAILDQTELLDTPLITTIDMTVKILVPAANMSKLNARLRKYYKGYLP